MTDEDLDEMIDAFEAGTLPERDFTHAAHVRAAWWYLRQAPFTEALARFTRALRAFAHRHGADAKYHETITVAWMAVIADRLDQTPDLPWSAFAERHADLLASRPSVLSRYYDDETLASDRARRVFVLPEIGWLTPRRLDARRPTTAAASCAGTP